MLYRALLVAIGGLIGGALRFLTITLLSKVVESQFPIATLFVNIVGCLLIGIFIGLADRSVSFNPDLRLFLATGLCGGFTTFSTFAYENAILLKTEHYLFFALYGLGSYGLGILAVFLGLYITKV